MNKNEEAILHDNDYLDFDELEEKLNSELEESLSDLEFLKEEKEKIANPDHLGEVIQGVIWEQFLNQVAATAGEDFIKENNGLTLDLRSEAHIQTTDNFANGKIATHNTHIDYQQRYDDWQSNFQHDENGNVITHTTRSGKEEATLAKGARKPFDEGRPTGSAKNHTDMDHTVSAGEIIRDAEANAHMTKEEQIAFANSDKNLNEMDASQNRSKGDKSMDEWLDNPNSKGQKPDEIFDMSEEDKAKLKEKDAEAREEYRKQKKEGEKKSIEAGKKSQKEEAFRIGGTALRAAVMALLADLVKEIIGKLVKWFKSSQKSRETLMESIKEAIQSFISKMKNHLMTAGNTVSSTVVNAIVGPIFSTIKKAWMIIKQGAKSLKDAIAYLTNSENKGQPIGRKMLEAGKIIIAGMTGVGALVLGEVVEKGLMAVPVFAVEIPLIGSLANILGIFIGAVVAGIIGALAINYIEKRIAKSQKEENLSRQIEKRNEILNKQRNVTIISEERLKRDQTNVSSSIRERHKKAAEEMKQSVINISSNLEDDGNTDITLDEIDDLLDELEGNII